MGIFELFGGTTEKRIKGLQKKATERYGPPENRQKALDQLIEMETPEAISALIMRFTVAAEPSITDAEEKDFNFKAIVGFGEKAVEPLRAFLRKSDVATSWALKMLRALLPEAELVELCSQVLGQLGPEYTRNPEKKTVLINTLGGLKDERITPALIPFLEDPSDDVRIAAASALALQKDERAREPMLQAFLASSDRVRVVSAITAALADSGFGVQGFREKIEKSLPEGFHLDRNGFIKKQG